MFDFISFSKKESHPTHTKNCPHPSKWKPNAFRVQIQILREYTGHINTQHYISATPLHPLQPSEQMNEPLPSSQK